MIPIRITLQGIYSYQEKQTIDFEKLTDARLFGIFGAVGSGKSTILEAMMFALYGETDRLNKSGDSRNYNMMNLKSDHLLIEFEFIGGAAEKLYRYKVEGKRSGKNFDNVKKLERRSYTWTNEKWEPLPEKYNTAEEILGLPYEHFKRTIIIPQGKFQEFLGMTKGDRNKMFRDIYPRLQEAELWKNVRVLRADTKDKMTAFTSKLEMLGELDPQVVEAKTKLVKDLVTEEEKLKKALDVSQKALELEDERKKQHDNLQKELTVLKGLQEQEKEVGEKAARLKQYEQVVSKFSTKLTQLDDRIKQVSDAKANLEKLTKDLENWKDKQRKLSTALETLKPAYDKRDETKTKLDDLELWAKVGELQVQILADQKGEKERVELIEQSKKELEGAKEQLAAFKTQLETQTKAMPDLEQLQQLRMWFSKSKEFSQQISDEDKKVLENQKQVLQHLDSFAPEGWMLKESMLDKKSDSEQVWSEKLETLAAKLATEIKAVESNISVLKVQQKLGEHAAALVDGEPCKLCGSLEHPEVFDEGMVVEELKGKEQGLLALQERVEALQSQRSKLDSILILVTNNREEIKRSEAALVELKKDHQAHLDAFAFNGFTTADAAKVEQLDKDAAQQQKRLTEAQSQVNTQQQLVDKTTENLQTKVDANNKASENIKNAQARSETLQSQIKQVKTGEVESKSVAELRAIIQQETVVLEQLEKEFAELQKEFDETKELIAAVTGQVSASQQSMKDAQQAKDKVQLEIDDLVSASEFDSVDEAKKILSLQLNVDAERKSIDEFNQQLHTTKATIAALQQSIGKQGFSEESYLKFKSEFEEKQKGFAAHHDTLVQEKQQLEILETKWKQYQEIHKEIEKLKVREDNLATLGNLFHNEGFLDYIASVYLQNLCNAANARFQSLTRQRLILEIDDKNEFRVIDALNGGKVRSVKTLSGGQMFQASLSLALALSESIQSSAGTEQNFFFLDEGFGTQDKESLRLVFESLKELRKENRVVGLISHVDELQDEIDVCLKVRNDEEVGSLVEVVG